MLYVTRRIQDGEHYAKVKLHGTVYEDENQLKVVEQIHSDYPEYKNYPIAVKYETKSHWISTIWGTEHQGYDIISIEPHVEDGRMWWDVEVLLEDINKGITDHEINMIMIELIRYKDAKTLEEAVVYGKSKVKRDSLLFIRTV